MHIIELKFDTRRIVNRATAIHDAVAVLELNFG